MVCEVVRSDDHTMLIEFDAIPFFQETNQQPVIKDDTQATKQTSDSQVELPEWAPWVPKPAPERQPLRVADRHTSEKIREILRDADQLDSRASLPLSSPSAQRDATQIPTTETKPVGAFERTVASSLEKAEVGAIPEELHLTFDERKPLDAEFTENQSFDLQQFSPPHVRMDGYAGFQMAQATPTSSPDVFSSSYDGLVDSFVGQMLAGGCATPNHLPGTISILNPPIGACHQPLSSGWYAQANALFLQPLGSPDFAASVDGLTDTTRIDVGSLHEGLASGASALLGVRTGNSAIELEWWSLFESREHETATDAGGNLRWLIPFGQLDVDPTGAAQLHQLRGEYEVHSFELNKRHLLLNRDIGVLQFAYLWGVRFVRLRDALNFQADSNDTILDGSAGEYSYGASVDNRLFGPQIGGGAHWQIANRLAATLDFKTGVFYNYVEHDQLASGTLGPATILSGVDAGRGYSLDNSASQVSMIAELKLNLEYALRPNLRFLVGYRMFGAQNVALATSQIPRSFENLDRIEPTVSDSLLLHGLQIGFDASF